MAGLCSCPGGSKYGKTLRYVLCQESGEVLNVYGCREKLPFGSLVWSILGGVQGNAGECFSTCVGYAAILNIEFQRRPLSCNVFII